MPFDSGSALVRYDAACRALAEAKAVDEVKDLRDKAEAMRIYAQQAKNKTLEVDAAEIRLRAERRLGEMIAAQKAGDGLSKGAAGTGINQHTPKDEVPSSVTRAPKLADAGISYDLSSRAQKLAAVSEEEFEEQVEEWRERVQAEGERVTTNLVQAGERAMAGKPEKAKPLSEVEMLQIENDELKDRLVEMSRDLDVYLKIAEADGNTDNVVKTLSEKLRAAEIHRDTLMRENSELKREVKRLQRKLGQKV